MQHSTFKFVFAIFPHCCAKLGWSLHALGEGPYVRQHCTAAKLVKHPHKNSNSKTFLFNYFNYSIVSLTARLALSGVLNLK